MSESTRPSAVPRVALRWPEEAAAALGVSADTLQRHGVAGEVRLWRLGALRLVAVDELERLVSEKSARSAAEASCSLRRRRRSSNLARRTPPFEAAFVTRGRVRPPPGS